MDMQLVEILNPAWWTPRKLITVIIFVTIAFVIVREAIRE